jgi:peptide deformylase
VRDLLDTVEPPGRAGLAAPQIGVGLRAFSYNVDGVIGYVLNPQLVRVEGELAPVEEGCLSVPGLWHPALRHPFARVEGIDLDGAPVVLEGEGLMAQCLQHEFDHLEGTLYLDRLTPERRRIAMREVRESSWF